MIRTVQLWRTVIAPGVRYHSSSCGCVNQISDAEKTMKDLLLNKIDGCSLVEVRDISNGCGSMFDVTVEATSFRGKTKVNQHKIVNHILRNQIKDMHGLTIKTKAT